MDLAAIRADVAAVLRTLGWQAYDHVPDTPPTLPAAVVNVPQDIEYEFTAAGNAKFTLPLELFADLATPADAQRRLDTALSTRMEGSVPDALHARSDAGGAAWRALAVVNASNPRQVVVGASTHALAVTINLLVVG